MNRGKKKKQQKNKTAKCYIGLKNSSILILFHLPAINCQLFQQLRTVWRWSGPRLFHYPNISAVQFKPHDCIDSLLSSWRWETWTGCFQFAAVETKKTKQAWWGRPSPPAVRSSIRSLERHVFFLAHNKKNQTNEKKNQKKKHVPVDYWVTTGSSICSRKLVKVTKNQDNISFDR